MEKQTYRDIIVKIVSTILNNTDNIIKLNSIPWRSQDDTNAKIFLENYNVKI